MIHASNAKFIEWVKIWLQEQEAQPFVKKHLKQVYQKALAGLEKHDGKLLTGHDAKRVPGIGDFIANKLESKRLEYIKKGGEWEEIPMRTESVPVVKKSASKPYCPRYGSSAYAILIGMSKLRQGTTRSDIILEAQKYTQTSLTESSGSKAGWSSMNKLLSEGLVFVQKQGNLHHYYLTDTGRELADKFRQYENKKSSQETLVDFNDLSLSHPESIPIDTALKRGSFEIVLVLDSREVKNQRQRSYFQTEFEKIGIKTMTKALALGDFVWIARPKDASKKLELVLDVLVERKSGDDLDMSIKDGRYKEQKNRLHNSKMRHIIYLLENMQMDDQSETRLFSAVAKIQLLNGFTVKITQTAAESVQYLARDQDLYVKEQMKVEKCEFVMLDEFNYRNQKTKRMTQQDVWMRQLMTIRGVSAQKASLIVSRYPTLVHFMDRPKMTLATLSKNRTSIGNKLAKDIESHF